MNAGNLRGEREVNRRWVADCGGREIHKSSAAIYDEAMERKAR